MRNLRRCRQLEPRERGIKKVHCRSNLTQSCLLIPTVLLIPTGANKEALHRVFSHQPAQLPDNPVESKADRSTRKACQTQVQCPAKPTTSLTISLEAPPKPQREVRAPPHLASSGELLTVDSGRKTSGSDKPSLSMQNWLSETKANAPWVPPNIGNPPTGGEEKKASSAQ